jgi:uncharacterized membrane protein
MAAVLQSIRPETPSVLRSDLRDGRSPGLLLRRAIVGMSFIGTACMAVTTLFQMGMVKRLADPPITGFDSDRVNGSDTAYGWGMPDSPLSIVSHATAIALAAVGGKDRARDKPLVPLAATAVATPAAVTAARYLFYDMPVKEKGWCPYCIVDGLAHIAVFGFTLWESARALRTLARR